MAEGEKGLEAEKVEVTGLDSVLGYGNYQRFQIWVLQTIIAIIGAINYYHVVFLVSDPPDDWHCAQPGVLR